MTVEELIKILSEEDPDSEVLMRETEEEPKIESELTSCETRSDFPPVRIIWIS